jgi:hypothetical protein
MLTRRKTIDGKQTCDRCTEKKPPIQECSWPVSPSDPRNYYMDLCSSCISTVERLFAKGVEVGAFGQPKSPGSSHSPSQRANVRGKTAP